MANTYTLISSNVLTSSAASVTFSSIPSTYTDLVVRWSARTDTGGTNLSMLLEFNADTATNYSSTIVYGDGSAASSARYSNATYMTSVGSVNGDGTTASTFSSGELYLPSYTVSQNKAFGTFGSNENNATSSRISANAGLWRNTATVTQIKLTPSSYSFVSGSSFYLYGIKNS